LPEIDIVLQVLLDARSAPQERAFRVRGVPAIDLD
jgi:hypothetical protein